MLKFQMEEALKAHPCSAVYIGCSLWGIGEHLKPHITDCIGNVQEILDFPKCTTNLKFEALKAHPSAVYIGAYDMFVEEPRTQKLYLIEDSSENLSLDIMNSLKELTNQIRRYVNNPDFPVILLPVYGVKLCKVNKQPEPLWSQRLINATVLDLSRKIMFNNNTRGYHTPRIHSIIHHIHGKKRVSNSYKLLFDGINPNDTTAANMANTICTTIKRNRDEGYHY